MADYFSLLARAVENLPRSSPAKTRHHIYERASKALINQLRSLRPQLPNSDIERELNSLNEAIKKLEEIYNRPDVEEQLPIEVNKNRVENAQMDVVFSLYRKKYFFLVLHYWLAVHLYC